MGFLRSHLEFVATALRAPAYIDENSPPVPHTNKSGVLKLYVDKETCLIYRELAWQWREMLPNVDLYWMDSLGRSY